MASNVRGRAEMGRKSTVDKLKPEVRSHIERRLRENRLTLDELIDDLQGKFPSAEHPSRSALGRYRQNFDTMMERMREQDRYARIMVEELGENPDDKAGALLVQSVTTLANRVLFDAQGDEDFDIEDLRKLTRAAKDLMHTRKLSLEQRREVERLAREKLLEEQREKLEQMGTKGGVTPETIGSIREALGIS